MTLLPRLAACALAGSLAGAAAWAQPAASPPAAPGAADPAATATVSLHEALEAAWRRAVAARETDGQRRQAEAERGLSDRPWSAPPTLSLGLRSERALGGGSGRETELGIAVPLWLPGQRTARTGAADAALAQALAAEQAARLRLAGELRDTAWALAALQAEHAQARTQATALERLADDVERRVRAGDLARADHLAAQAEHLAAAAAATDALQRLQAARARWTWLTGLSVLPALPAWPTADAPDEGPADLARHPEVLLAEQAADLAQKRVDLMRRSRRDAPELSLGVRHDAPGRGEPSQDSLVIGLRLPFGTDERNRLQEATALSALDVARTQAQRLHERLDAEAATALDALRAAQAQRDAETRRARLLRDRAALIDRAFRAGETALPDLLRALAAAAQADAAVARQTAALGLARARHQQALGRLP